MLRSELLSRWIHTYSLPDPRSSALFLDRDGTVIENVPYINDPDAVSLIPGARETIQAFRDAGFAILIVTNQSGIARGLCTETQYHAVTRRMSALLGNGLIDAVFASPFHPSGAGMYASEHHWRKPAPGMINAASKLFKLELTSSVVIGDSLSDIQAGIAAGVGRAVHVLTGHGAKERNKVRAFSAERARCVGAPVIEFAESLSAISPRKPNDQKPIKRSVQV